MNTNNNTINNTIVASMRTALKSEGSFDSAAFEAAVSRVIADAGMFTITEVGVRRAYNIKVQEKMGWK